LNGKLLRLGKVTFNELRKQIYRSLLCASPVQFFSGLNHPETGPNQKAWPQAVRRLTASGPESDGLS